MRQFAAYRSAGFVVSWIKTNGMHRAFESFLLAVISLPLIVAAVCGSELFRSPACCRRDGPSVAQ